MIRTNGAKLLEQPTTREWNVLGEGLLPNDWEEGREKRVHKLSAAYAQVVEGKEDNYLLWMNMRRQLRAFFERKWKEVGLEAPPWNLDARLLQLVPYYPKDDPNGHIALVSAMMTDYGARCCEHIRYRLEHNGNVHIEIAGFTGSAKSSSAISIADWIKRIRRGNLVDHLSIDLFELPKKLASKGPWETVIQDEYTKLAGEGANTQQALFANVEDTIRASQVNLLAVSPRRQEHGTMQCVLEAVLNDWKRMYTAFLVWIDDFPHGLWAIPWAAEELWNDEYTPWKKKNVERSLAGHFKDNTYLVRTAMAVFEEQRFVEYFEAATNKPKKTDFSNAMELFLPQMLTHSQIDKIVSMMFNLTTNYDRLAPKMEAWFGVKPNDGLRRVAKKTGK